MPGLHIPEYSKEENGAVPVAVRLIFLRVGNINTEEEQFQAHVAIEARWFLRPTDHEDDLLSSLSTDDRVKLNDGQNIKLPQDYSEKHWHPQLFILNIGRGSEEKISYTMREVASRIEICEFHDLHGSFYSQFDLHHFPNDTQALNIAIGSALFDTDVMLEVDTYRTSEINHEAFHEPAEWKFYRHVDARMKFVQGFFFQNDDANGKVDPSGYERKRSVITVACHAVRCASYFYWNVSYLLPLITLISFVSFAIPLNVTESRIHVVCTLLLASVVFRWTISRSVPNTPYLTIVDRYAIVSILVLLILCLWHAIIGSMIFMGDRQHMSAPYSRWAWIDSVVFRALLSSFIIIHLAMGIWHWRVRLSIHRQMNALDDRYKRLVERNSMNKDVAFLV